MVARPQLTRTERVPTTATDFQKELMRLNDAVESHNWLVYGDSNAGKTVFASTAPGKTLWLAGEPGFKSAVRRGATGYVRQVTDSSMAWAAVEWLQEKDRARKLDWLIVDGVTTMQDKIRLNYCAEAFDRDSTKRAHRNLPDRPDYFNTQNWAKAWFGALVDLPVNLLVTAHAYRTDSTENGELLVFPGFQGKVTEIANAISGLMDVTAYYVNKTVKNRRGATKNVRRMYFSTPKSDELRYIVGDKSGNLPAYLDFPTVPDMLEIVERRENA
jgi:hypothetical protein